MGLGFYFNKKDTKLPISIHIDCYPTIDQGVILTAYTYKKEILGQFVKTSSDSLFITTIDYTGIVEDFVYWLNNSQ